MQPLKRFSPLRVTVFHVTNSGYFSFGDVFLRFAPGSLLVDKEVRELASLLSGVLLLAL